MRVLYCHPLEPKKTRDAIAFVDVELSGDLRLLGLMLLRQPDGNYFIYAPQAGECRTASFSRYLAEELTALAVQAYEAASNER